MKDWTKKEKLSRAFFDRKQRKWWARWTEDFESFLDESLSSFGYHIILNLLDLVILVRSDMFFSGVDMKVQDYNTWFLYNDTHTRTVQWRILYEQRKKIIAFEENSRTRRRKKCWSQTNDYHCTSTALR